jgi:hypothetical protein
MISFGGSAMQIYLQKDKLCFFGTVKELREFLRTLRGDERTLREYITAKFH